MQRELAPRVVADPAILAGKPIIAGTRISVSALVREIAAGKTIEAVVREHGLSPDDVRAALDYAATRADEVTPSDSSSSFAERLTALRAQIVASGDPLLDWDDVSTEVAERRNERYTDEQP